MKVSIGQILCVIFVFAVCVAGFIAIAKDSDRIRNRYPYLSGQYQQDRMVSGGCTGFITYDGKYSWEEGNKEFPSDIEALNRAKASWCEE